MDEKNLVVIREFNGKYKINQDYKPIAEKLKAKFNELQYVPVDYILFVENLEDKKKSKNKIVFAQISKIPGKRDDIIYQVTGRRFVYMIEIFKENIVDMSREQIVALIYHELHHIQFVKDDVKLVGHDVEDWSNMIVALGTDWASTISDIPDLLSDDVIWDGIEDQLNLFNQQGLRLVK